MRVQKISVIVIVFIFTTCLAFSCISSAFAQCREGVLCEFGQWCCETKEYCVDPTPPYCERIDGTTTTSVDGATTSTTSTPQSTTTTPNTTTSVSSTTTTAECPFGCAVYVCCGGSCCEDEDYICVTNVCRPSSCFSSFVYGEGSEEVDLLRDFRDNVLSQTQAGQEIIELYYQWSPVIVKAMEEDEGFKEQLREMIDGVLELIRGEVE